MKDERERGFGNQPANNGWGASNDVDMASPDNFGGRGRGRGRDRDAAGGGNTCFKCQQEGHFARECPNDNGQGSKGRGPMKCFNCQGEGHMSKECTEPRKPREGGDRGPMKCYNCQGEGHMSRDCNEPRRPRDRDGDDRGGYKRPRHDNGGGNESGW